MSIKVHKKLHLLIKQCDIILQIVLGLWVVTRISRQISKTMMNICTMVW